MVGKACAFTGHRVSKLPFLADESDPRCLALKSEIARAVAGKIAEGYDMFYTGGADGADLLCAEAVLAARERQPWVHLGFVLPYLGFSAKGRRGEALARANLVVYVSLGYYAGCYMKRNRYLVEHSLSLIAIYDEELAGGTSYTVKEARRQGKDVLVIQPR